MSMRRISPGVYQGPNGQTMRPQGGMPPGPQPMNPNRFQGLQGTAQQLGGWAGGGVGGGIHDDMMRWGQNGAPSYANRAFGGGGGGSPTPMMPNGQPYPQPQMPNESGYGPQQQQDNANRAYMSGAGGGGGQSGGPGMQAQQQADMLARSNAIGSYQQPMNGNGLSPGVQGIVNQFPGQQPPPQQQQGGGLSQGVQDIVNRFPGQQQPQQQPLPAGVANNIGNFPKMGGAYGPQKPATPQGLLSAPPQMGTRVSPGRYRMPNGQVVNR